MISQPPMPGAPERPAIRRGGVPWCRAPAQQLGSPQLGKSLPAADTATLGGCARVGSPLLASHVVGVTFSVTVRTVGFMVEISIFTEFVRI